MRAIGLVLLAGLLSGSGIHGDRSSAVDSSGISPGRLTLRDGFASAGFAVSALATPVNGTHSSSATGGTLLASTQYCYRVAALNTAGTTLPSAETCLTTDAGDNTYTVTAVWGEVTGATGYKIYCRTTGGELLCATIAGGVTTSWLDNGAVTPSGAMPIRNTTADIAIPINTYMKFGSGTNSYIYHDGDAFYIGESVLFPNNSIFYGGGMGYVGGAPQVILQNDGRLRLVPPDGHGVQLGTSGSKKTCDGTAADATHAGEGDLFFTAGATGALSICQRTGSVWGWVTVTTTP